MRSFSTLGPVHSIINTLTVFRLYFHICYLWMTWELFNIKGCTMFVWQNSMTYSCSPFDRSLMAMILLWMLFTSFVLGRWIVNYFLWVFVVVKTRHTNYHEICTNTKSFIFRYICFEDIFKWKSVITIRYKYIVNIIKQRKKNPQFLPNFLKSWTT